MKNSIRVFWIIMLIIGILLPVQAVYAKSNQEGPIFGSNFTLKSGETLNEDLVVFGGSVSIEKGATVNGAVVLFGGSLTLDGEVSKDVVALGAAVKLGAATHVHGNLVTFGAAVSRDPAAVVDGDVINNPSKPSAPVVPAIPALVKTSANPLLQALSILGESFILALLAMLITMFLPNQMRRVADGAIAQPLIAFGLGLLSLIAYIVAVVALALFSILIITLLITVPLIVLISILLAAAMVLGWLAIGLEVGIRVSQMFKKEWPLPLSAGLGVFFLNLVAQGVGFIPCIGWLISVMVGFAGLGAVVMTRFGTRASVEPRIIPAPIIPASDAG